MKKALGILVIVGALLISGCQSSTQYGECVGLEDQQDSHLVYKPSVRNIVLGVAFFETLFAPIIWLACDFDCPVGRK